jgi:hypothetical protein
MNVQNYIGKALLTVILPPAFAVISSLTISALFAMIGCMMGHNTFVACFQSMLGNITVVMCLIAFVGTICYYAKEQ